MQNVDSIVKKNKCQYMICSVRIDGWSRVLHPTRHKIGHFGDVLPRQPLGSVLNKYTHVLWMTECD